MSTATAVEAVNTVPDADPARSWIATGVLATASVVAIAIGAGSLFMPTGFYQSYGINLAGETNALNETRATGAALLGMGVLMGIGALRPRWAAASAVVGTTVFLGYGLARVLSVAIDGSPASSLTVAGVVEVAIGAACVSAWILLRRTRTRATR